MGNAVRTRKLRFYAAGEPGAESGTIFNRERQEFVFDRWFPTINDRRVGLKGYADHFDTEAEAIALAEEFIKQVRDTVVREGIKPSW